MARAVGEGRFHVWAADTIEEGIEILTGLPAGERDATGLYPEGTIFRRVADRLDEFARAVSGERVAAVTDAAYIGIPPAPPSRPPGIPPDPPPEPPVQL